MGLACVSCYEWKDGRRRRKRKRGDMEGDEGEGGRQEQRKLMEHLEIFWNHWTVFLILSNRAWKRGLSK